MPPKYYSAGGPCSDSSKTYHVGASLSGQVVQLIGSDSIVDSKLNLLGDKFKINEVRIKSKGQGLEPFVNNRDIEGFYRAITGENVERLLGWCFHIHYGKYANYLL